MMRSAAVVRAGLDAEVWEATWALSDDSAGGLRATLEHLVFELRALLSDALDWNPEPVRGVPATCTQTLPDRVIDPKDQPRMAAHFERTGGTFRQGEYWQRMQDRAHRRYLGAIRAPAQVRRLLAPAVQVNIAEHQVNLAG